MISQSVQDKQKDILAAALRLFVENGFHGTPTSRIAKEAGVANGTLFHYFKTKEDLIVGLYLDIKKRMGILIEEKTAAAASPKERFRIQFTQVVLWAIDNREEFQYLQQFSNSPFATLLSPEDIKQQLRKSCHDIEEAIQGDLIKERNPEFILSLMSSHVFGLTQYLMKNKFTKKEQEKIIDDGFAMLWAMLA